MTIPVVYSFLWMAIFGAVGIKMERKAYNAVPRVLCNDTFGSPDSGLGCVAGVYRLSCRLGDFSSSNADVKFARVWEASL